MGSFYDNVLVTAPLDRVVERLRAMEATGLATTAGPGWTVVYPRDPFDIAALSRDLECSALIADVHDSDVLWLEIWTAGDLIHEYCNAPTYFAEEFADIDGVPHGRVRFGEAEPRWLPNAPLGVRAEPFGPFAIGEPETDALLAALSDRPLDPGTPTHEGGYLFANGLHRDAMAALGLPTGLLTTGFFYLSRADRPNTDYSVFVPFGDAVQPDPAAPEPVSRLTQEQMTAICEQSRMQAVLSGGPRDGEVDWVPFHAMQTGIDSGDGGSYRFVVDPADPGVTTWMYVSGDDSSAQPGADGTTAA
jgi:hypothetical protein